MKNISVCKSKRFTWSLIQMLSIGALFLFTLQASAASLHRQILLEGKNLTLGDVFEGAGQYADRIIARAPAPGKRTTLTPEWLAYVARSYNLQWMPLSATDRAVVERTSHVIGKEEISAKILNALTPELPPAEVYTVHFDNRTAEVHLPTNIPPTLYIERITRDKLSNRFFAVFAADRGRHRHTVSGRLLRIVEIPVVTRRMRKGEVVGLNDVQMITVRANQIGPNVIINKEEVLGKSPRRTLVENRPIRSNDVRQPVLVKRGGLVSMIYQTKFMRISARGKAKQNGSRGEAVRVENIGSKKVVEGVITGPGEITVTLDHSIAKR